MINNNKIRTLIMMGVISTSMMPTAFATSHVDTWQGKQNITDIGYLRWTKDGEFVNGEDKLIRQMKKNTVVITPMDVQTKRDPDKQYYYKVNIHYVDYETNKIIQTQETNTYNSTNKYTKEQITPQITHFKVPTGYVLDYTTQYVPQKITKDVNMFVRIRKDRIIRFHYGNSVIASQEVNRFSPQTDDIVIPKGFKTPNIPFNGYRLDQNVFVQDIELEKTDKVDYTKDQETVNKQIEDVKSAETITPNKKFIYNQSRLEKIKQSHAYIKEHNKKEYTNDGRELVALAPKINDKVTVHVIHEYIDADTGALVGRKITDYKYNEKLIRNDAPYGFTNVSPELPDYYVQNPFTELIPVRRSATISDLINKNQVYKGEEQTKSSDEATERYAQGLSTKPTKEGFNQNDKDNSKKIEFSKYKRPGELLYKSDTGEEQYRENRPEEDQINYDSNNKLIENPNAEKTDLKVDKLIDNNNINKVRKSLEKTLDNKDNNTDKESLINRIINALKDILK